MRGSFVKIWTTYGFTEIEEENQFIVLEYVLVEIWVLIGSEGQLSGNGTFGGNKFSLKNKQINILENILIEMLALFYNVNW